MLTLEHAGSMDGRTSMQPAERVWSSSSVREDPGDEGESNEDGPRLEA